MAAYKVWTAADGLSAVEIDEEGCWLRRRAHPADSWDAPEKLLYAGGSEGTFGLRESLLRLELDGRL